MKSKSFLICIMLFIFSQIAFAQDVLSYIKTAQNYYNNSGYRMAYPIYKKIVTEMKYNDGIILYQYYYSYRTLYGMDSVCKKLLKNAYDTLLLQYPKHKYVKYASDRLYSKITDNKHAVNSSLDNINRKTDNVTTTSTVSIYNSSSHIAENGDVYGHDNDGDGRAETVYVSGYYRKDGTYVRSHYRASPKK